MKRYVFYLYMAVVALMLTELALRVYNPFPSGIKGNKIVLGVNATLEFENNNIPVIDKKIVHTKNALGFRGPNMPVDWQNYLTILLVGGSTTECNYLSDGKTWGDKLSTQLSTSYNNVWVNNAGLAGHSSFGHNILLEDYLVRLKPDMIFFLVGCNDVSRADLVEDYNMKGRYSSIGSFFVKNSELCNTVNNIVRAKRAKTNNLTDHYVDLSKNTGDTMHYSPDQIAMELAAHQVKYLPAYKKRLELLIKTCKQNNIVPAFITQPSLFGEGVDPETHGDLEKRKTGFHNYNGKMWWEVLEAYNDVTRSLAKEHNLVLSDLAREMPKSSLYFYDMVHFTGQGTDLVSRIVYKDLNSYLQQPGSLSQKLRRSYVSRLPAY